MKTRKSQYSSSSSFIKSKESRYWENVKS